MRDIIIEIHFLKLGNYFFLVMKFFACTLHHLWYLVALFDSLIKNDRAIRAAVAWLTARLVEHPTRYYATCRAMPRGKSRTVVSSLMINKIIFPK